MRRDGTSPR
uniref:Uncharacterized protein n=1 Tax=Arundo donax TaxID=35708 RepID=A0A0A9H3Z2_ARUDO